MADKTKIAGFRNITSGRQTSFVTDDGKVKIRQINARIWAVLPRGGSPYHVRGRRAAIDEARGIKSGLTRSHVAGLGLAHHILEKRLSLESVTKAPKRTPKKKPGWLFRKLFGA
jgi:hypothetical protein